MFIDNLHWLYATYSAHKPDDSDMVGQWTGLRLRALDNSLTENDWGSIQKMFRLVIRKSETIDSDQLMHLALRFGALNHRVYTDGPDADGNQTSPATGRNSKKEKIEFNTVDTVKLGALHYAYQLGSDETSMEVGLKAYLNIDSRLRSHFTDIMLVLEQVLGSFATLDENSLSEPARLSLGNETLRPFLESAFTDLKDLLLENGGNPLLNYHAIMNILYRGNAPVSVFRVHINMTSINERDPSNFHGTAFLKLVKNWFQQKYGMVHVIQNPERTTFAFIARSSEQVRETLSHFASDIMTRMRTMPGIKPDVISQFSPRAVVSGRAIGRSHIYEYAIQTLADVEIFRMVIEYDWDRRNGKIEDLTLEQILEILKDKEPNFNDIKKSGDRSLIRTLSALILKSIVEFHRTLAAQTTFFEKELVNSHSDQPDMSGNATTRQKIYMANDLPKPGTPYFAKWTSYLSRKAGFVGPGQYHPSRDNEALATLDHDTIPAFSTVGSEAESHFFRDDPNVHSEVNMILRTIPRVGHIKGNISHEREGSHGGHLEQFYGALQTLAFCPIEQVGTHLQNAKRVASNLLNAFRVLYDHAIRDPRNSMTLKQHETFNLFRGETQVPFASDFFLQEVALTGNTYLASMEYDSFKAYNDTYGTGNAGRLNPASIVLDMDYNRVRDALFMAATQMNMKMPIVNPTGGDHLSLSYADKDNDGHDINPVDYLKLAQKIVRDSFSEKKFHDYHKVDVAEFQLQFSSEYSRVFDRDFLARMRVEFDLSADIHVEKRGGDFVNFSVPFPLNWKKEGDIKAKLQEYRMKVLQYLGAMGIAGIPTEDPNLQTKRLPMWLSDSDPKGGLVSTHWYFGKEAPDDSYVPFKRSLTVSFALAEHKPLILPSDIRQFQSARKKVDDALGGAKEKSWPNKQGFIDIRSRHRRRSSKSPKIAGMNFRRQPNGRSIPSPFNWRSGGLSLRGRSGRH